MELIAGLPNDVAYDCLVRVTYKEFATVASVCKGWKGKIESPEFRHHRIEAGNSQKVVVVAQAQVNQDQNSATVKNQVPLYRFSLLEPEKGSWSALPLAPGWENGLPRFCQVASVKWGLVVLGGMDPVTWEASNSVLVFDFVSATWRRGADMPGLSRLFFGCTSDLDRMVYVVGGHDNEKNALKSALSYDVVKDEWVSLPDMARERDESKAIFHGGKLHVIGGYCTETQGQFERSAEVFDVATREWEQIQQNFLESAECPKTCVSTNDGTLYMCRQSEVVTLKNSTWRAIAKLPADMANAAYLATWQGNLLVIGSGGMGESHVAYVFNTKTCKWTKVKTPKQYSGHVQSGCFLEI